MVSIVRFIVQHFMFIVLMFGGRFGIKLGHSVPCFACPYVSGCGGHCYLMALQGQWNLGYLLPDVFSAQGLRILTYFGVFVLFVLPLSKIWCGWICPFGTLQDWLTWARKKMGIREAQFSWKTRDRLRPVKYILLAYLLIVPVFIVHAGLHSDFALPFCKICPAKPIMPLFVGNFKHFALDYTNTITLVFSILSVSIAAGIIVGSFYKDRLFCMLCPMLPLIQMLKKISFIRFEKTLDGCLGCGNCQRMCPVDIREVSLEKEKKEVMDEDCMLCFKCAESCPEDHVLTIKFFKYRLFSSSRKYVAGKHAQRKKK